MKPPGDFVGKICLVSLFNKLIESTSQSGHTDGSRNEGGGDTAASAQKTANATASLLGRCSLVFYTLGRRTWAICLGTNTYGVIPAIGCLSLDPAF